MTLLLVAILSLAVIHKDQIPETFLSGVSDAALQTVTGFSEDRYFENLVNNVGVPSSTIRKYAAEQGISRDEAKRKMGEEAREAGTRE